MTDLIQSLTLLVLAVAQIYQTRTMRALRARQALTDEVLKRLAEQ